MSRYVELQRTAKRHIKQLHAFADRENRQATRERLFGCVKFPAIAFRVYILVEDGGIGHWLLKKFLRDIRPAAQEQAVHFFDRHLLAQGVPETHVGMRREGATKPLLVLEPNPGCHVEHGGLCDPSSPL